MNVQLHPHASQGVGANGVSIVPRLEHLCLDDDPSYLLPELHLDTPLDDAKQQKKKRDKGQPERKRLFLRTPRHIAGAFPGLGTGATTPHNQQELKSERRAGDGVRCEQTVQSLPVGAKCIDLLTEDEVNDITQTNTKQNAKRDLKKRLSRIQQKLSRLSSQPELEAIPLIRPPERVLAPRSESFPTVKNILGCRVSNELLKESFEENQIDGYRSNGALQLGRCLSTISLGLDPMTEELASNGNLGTPTHRKSYLRDSPTLQHSTSTGSKRPSVRISTSVLVIQNSSDGESQMLVNVDRDGHPSRTRSYASSPQRRENDELTTEAEIGHDQFGRRSRKESNDDNQHTPAHGSKRPILATSLMR
jgi:hypothetical protein